MNSRPFELTATGDVFEGLATALEMNPDEFMRYVTPDGTIASDGIDFTDPKKAG